MHAIKNPVSLLLAAAEPDMTVEENLLTATLLCGLPRAEGRALVDEVARLFAIGSRRDHPLGRVEPTVRRRYAVAVAAIVDLTMPPAVVDDARPPCFVCDPTAAPGDITVVTSCDGCRS